MMQRSGRAAPANTPASGIFDPRLAQRSTNVNGRSRPYLDSALEGVFVNSGGGNWARDSMGLQYEPMHRARA